MSFGTANNTFRQLLGNGLSYRVPAFQRDYSWTEDEWDDLWHDILGTLEENEEPAHYMGYLVLQTGDNKQFDIIDGQQRITTISLIILAALSHLQDLVISGRDPDDNAKRKEQLRNSYIGYLDPVSLVPRSKLELNRHNNSFYQNYLVPLERLPQRGLKASEHQLRKSFGWFKDRIREFSDSNAGSGKKVAAFIDGLVDRLFFTVITVNDELNAFKVFETLNARGVRLSATDLLKNYLFSVIASDSIHETELKNLEERWERIVGLLGSESFPEFLRVFWNSRNKLVRKSDLFKTIRKHIQHRDAAFKLIRDLDESASIYAALRDPQDEFWAPKERQALGQLLMFSVRQPLAMLLSCYLRYFNSDRNGFSRILTSVSIISFRYNVICNLQTHEQERRYNDIAWKVSEGVYQEAQGVICALEDIYPDDAQFRTAFSEKHLRTTNSRNRKIVRYILFEIEKQKSGQHFDFESVKYNLEHILPENPSEEWGHVEESKQSRLIYRIGNMTPLEMSTNQKIGNAEYSLKRKAYAGSKFQITRAVAENYDSWDEYKVAARQQSLAKIASGIWRIDFGPCRKQ